MKNIALFCNSKASDVPNFMWNFNWNGTIPGSLVRCSPWSDPSRLGHWSTSSPSASEAARCQCNHCRAVTPCLTPATMSIAGSGVERIDPLRFLTGCRTKRLNQALSVLSLNVDFLSVSVVLLTRTTFYVVLFLCYLSVLCVCCSC